MTYLDVKIALESSGRVRVHSRRRGVHVFAESPGELSLIYQQKIHSFHQWEQGIGTKLPVRRQLTNTRGGVEAGKAKWNRVKAK